MTGPLLCNLQYPLHAYEPCAVRFLPFYQWLFQVSMSWRKQDHER